jgi:hypothetical protein
VQANVVVYEGDAITKRGPLRGKKPAYWTKNGITAFFFGSEEDLRKLNAPTLPATPGMVGVDCLAERLYVILADGEAHLLCDMQDFRAREFMRAVAEQTNEGTDA